MKTLLSVLFFVPWFLFSKHVLFEKLLQLNRKPFFLPYIRSLCGLFLSPLAIINKIIVIRISSYIHLLVILALLEDCFNRTKTNAQSYGTIHWKPIDRSFSISISRFILRAHTGSFVTSNAQVELGGLHPVCTMLKMETDTFYSIYHVFSDFRLICARYA